MDLEKLVEDLKISVRETILQYKDEIMNEAKKEVIQSVIEELQRNQVAFKVYGSKIDSLRVAVEEIKSSNENLAITFDNEINKLKSDVRDIVNRISALKSQTDKLTLLKEEMQEIVLTTTLLKQQVTDIFKRLEQIEKKQENLAVQMMAVASSSNNEISKLASKVSDIEADILSVRGKIGSLVQQNDAILKIVEDINKAVTEGNL